MSISFTPDAGKFESNRLFDVLLSGVTDWAGNALFPFHSTFQTGAAEDTDPPVVVSSTPGNGDTAPLNTTVTIHFNQPVNPVTVSADTISVKLTPSGIFITGSYALNNTAQDGTVTFTPSSLLPPGTGVNLRVSGVQDYAGNDNPDYEIVFTTAGTADNTPLVITSVTPTDGATGMGINTVVNLTFSKPLNPGTVNDTTFGLFKGTTRMPVQIGNQPDFRTVTLTALLETETTYTVIVTSGVRDLAGNALADFRSKFTTLVTPGGNVYPSVVSMRPANSATKVPLNAAIVLYVNRALNAATVAGALHVSQNGVPVAGSTQLLGSGQVLQFKPSSPLLAGAFVQVFLDATAKDTVGNSFGAFQGSFTTLEDVSASPPIVTRSSASLNGPATVPTNGFLDIEFSKAINQATIDPPNIKLQHAPPFPAEPTDVPSASTMYNDHTVRVKGTSSLLPGEIYRVVVSTDVKDTGGQSSASTQFATFQAAAGPDNGQPQVLAITPPDGSLNIGDNAPIFLHFSEPVDPITVSNSTVQISAGGNVLSPVNIAFANNSLRDVVFTPLTALARFDDDFDRGDRGAGPGGKYDHPVQRVVHDALGAGALRRSRGVHESTPERDRCADPIRRSTCSSTCRSTRPQ